MAKLVHSSISIYKNNNNWPIDLIRSCRWSRHIVALTHQTICKRNSWPRPIKSLRTPTANTTQNPQKPRNWRPARNPTSTSPLFWNHLAAISKTKSLWSRTSTPIRDFMPSWSLGARVAVGSGVTVRKTHFLPYLRLGSMSYVPKRLKGSRSKCQNRPIWINGPNRKCRCTWMSNNPRRRLRESLVCMPAQPGQCFRLKGKDLCEETIITDICFRVSSNSKVCKIYA